MTYTNASPAGQCLLQSAWALGSSNLLARRGNWAWVVLPGEETWWLLLKYEAFENANTESPARSMESFVHRVIIVRLGLWRQLGPPFICVTLRVNNNRLLLGWSWPCRLCSDLSISLNVKVHEFRIFQANLYAKQSGVSGLRAFSMTGPWKLNMGEEFTGQKLRNH